MKVKISIQGLYDGDWVEECILIGKADLSQVCEFLQKKFNLKEW